MSKSTEVSQSTPTPYRGTESRSKFELEIALEKAEAELAEASQELAEMEANRKAYYQKIDDAESQIMGLREALEWYADEDNYIRWACGTRQDAPEVAAINEDGGKRARDALAGKEEPSNIDPEILSKMSPVICGCCGRTLR